MKHGMVECKECRYWVPFDPEDLEQAPGRKDLGLCQQFRSSNWLMRMQKDQYCSHGELKQG